MDLGKLNNVQNIYMNIDQYKAKYNPTKSKDFMQRLYDKMALETDQTKFMLLHWY